MKLAFFIVNLIFALLCSNAFAQDNGVSILQKSESVKLKYSPSKPLISTSISFLRFKENYGVFISFVTEEKDKAIEYIEKVDSFILVFKSRRYLMLNTRLRDSVHIQNDGSYSWETVFIVNRDEFEEVRKQKVSSIIVFYNSHSLEMHLQGSSQNRIYSIAKIF